MPIFQNEGRYDHARYQFFSENLLRPNGVTDARFNELVRDHLRMEKLLVLIGSSIDASDTVLRTEYDRAWQKMHVALVRFDLAALKATIQPTPEQVEQVFRSRERSWVTPEERVVSFVTMDLDESQKALTGPAFAQARQALSNRAGDLYQELSKPGANFAEVAQKHGLKVQETPLFTRNAPSAMLEAMPQAADAAFRLNAERPLSDILIFSNTGYGVLHLEKTVPSRQLSLEEARPQVIEQIRLETASAALPPKALEARAKLMEAMQAGKTLQDAAKELKLKVETPAPFSLAEPPQEAALADAEQIVAVARAMQTGRWSDWVETPSGGLLIYMQEREPTDTAHFEQEKEAIWRNIVHLKRLALFIEWLTEERKIATIHGRS